MTAGKPRPPVLAMLACAVVLAADLAAQVSAPAAGTILGRVVEAGSDRGLAGALVRLSADSLTSAPAPGGARNAQLPTALTDASGTFLFRDVAPGSYVVTAFAPGFFPAAFGQRDPEGTVRALRVRGDRPPPEISIDAWRHGVIAGTMRDEAGDPVVGAAVRALRRTPSGGQVQFMQVATANTDDRGAYRLSGLLPGAYVVLAPATTTSMDAATATTVANDMMRVATSGGIGSSQSPAVAAMMSSGTLLTPQGIRVGDALIAVPLMSNQATAIAPLPTGTGPMQVYRATYHPAASTITAASVVEVGSGEVHMADLTVTLAAGYRVSGRLSLADGTAGQQVVRLMPPGSDSINTDAEFETAVTMSHADGSFTLFGVPPGEYRLKVLRPGAQVPPGTAGGGANAPTLWADLPVSVGDVDVNGLIVPLQAGARVSGRLVFAGSPAPTTAEMSRAGVSLAPVNGRVIGRFPPAGGRPSATGEFETPAYPPGRYLLSVRSPQPAWIVRSIVAGGRDITGAALDLTGAADVDGIVVTLTNRPAAISGVIRGAASADVLVLVLPGDVERWIDAGAPDARMHRVWPDENGAFRVGSLPAGQYLVAAVDAGTRIEAGDSAAIRRLAREATEVSLAEGAERTVNLTVGIR